MPHSSPSSGTKSIVQGRRSQHRLMATPQQLEMLIAAKGQGLSDQAAAKASGLAPKTVTNWLGNGRKHENHNLSELSTHTQQCVQLWRAVSQAVGKGALTHACNINFSAIGQNPNEDAKPGLSKYMLTFFDPDQFDDHLKASQIGDRAVAQFLKYLSTKLTDEQWMAVVLAVEALPNVRLDKLMELAE